MSILNMRAVDEILRADRDRERRLRAAREAADALTKDEMGVFLAEMIRRVETGATKKRRRAASVAPTQVILVPAPRRRMRSEVAAERMAAATAAAAARTEDAGTDDEGRKTKFVDLAEMWVARHPEGTTVPEVATAIGQGVPSADGTLRHLARSRGTVESRDGLWFPVEVERAPKKTLRSAIATVLAKSKPLGTGDLHREIEKLMPGALKPSVAAEIGRMKEAGLLVERGHGTRGPLYGLTNGGAHPTAS